MNSVLAPQTAVIPPELATPVIKRPTLDDIINLSGIKTTPVLLDFNGGSLTSDAGILLLGQVEQQVGIAGGLASMLDDQRDPRYVTHSVNDLVTQRVMQIAAGYEDANDSDTLRDDPAFKLVVGRLPESDPDLASQPTMSRFENSVSRTALYRIARMFADNFIASYDKPPKVIVLDFDDTEDETHGDQQLSMFNGYFKSHCLMPFHVYEGLSGKLVTTILKPGKRSTGKQMLAIVKRLIAYLRKHFPDTLIVFRGDGHFAYPEVMDWIEQQEKVTYVIGFTGNKRLMKLVEQQIERATKLYNYNKIDIRLYHSIYYQAKSWGGYRRIIAKIEITAKGLNVRFIVTDMKQAKAKALYSEVYCARGNAELYIKEHKLHLKSDRTSCTRFSANQFRVFLHSAAYVLMHALRANVLKHTQWAKASFETIRLKFLKIAARVRQLRTRVKIELPSSCPLKKTLSRSFQIFEVLRQT